MSSSGNSRNVSDPMDSIDVRRQAITIELDSGSQGSVPFDMASGGSERLLDINGLLEIVRLINVAREDRRLIGGAKRSSDYGGV